MRSSIPMTGYACHSTTASRPPNRSRASARNRSGVNRCSSKEYSSSSQSHTCATVEHPAAHAASGRSYAAPVYPWRRRASSRHAARRSRQAGRSAGSAGPTKIFASSSARDCSGVSGPSSATSVGRSIGRGTSGSNV
ncbi:Uncharacterised protein [Mycobacteroides abscessus]|nr:Uncharacterised protein [Mycobacteroides abscessus]